MNALEVHNVGKQYRLGQVGTGTLSHDLNRWWARMRGKEDPYLQLGDVNDRTAKGGSGYVWALRDVSFNVGEGEVLGIVGRNGAGKSTLLKILSRVTAPTVGTIRGNGRVASLLEVGTGFHPELSGRDNVFLNGAILGMSRREIASKFDEIVAFAGVEKYIDTPVKRYSSGMYVRLAFAVAAHLEPEILIVDEVLAVGDAEFQKKCIGKMKDVSGQGRTVLFVSHNMASVKNLCTRGILMEQGTIKSDGPIDDIVAEYVSQGSNEGGFGIIGEDVKRVINVKDHVSIHSVQLKNDDGPAANFMKNEPVLVEVEVEVKNPVSDLIGMVSFNNTVAGKITYSSTIQENVKQRLQLDKGKYRLLYKVDANLLPGEYNVTVNLMNEKGYSYESIPNLGKFTVEKFSKDGREYFWPRNHGLVESNCDFELKKIG